MKQIPGLLSFSIVALVGISIVQILIGIEYRMLSVLCVSVLGFALAIGLAFGQKRAFALTLVVSVLGVALTSMKDLQNGLIVLVGNSVVVVPMLLSKNYFFKQQGVRGRLDIPRSAIIGFLVGGLFVFIVMGYCGLRYLDKERNSLYEGAVKVQLIAAARDLPVGTVLLPQDLSMKSIYKSAVGDNIFLPENFSVLVGQRTLYPIGQDAPMLKSQVEIPKHSGTN